MIVLDRPTVTLINKLKKSKDFQLFIDYLQRELDNQDIQNRTAKNEQLLWGQGKAQFISDLLVEINKAEESFNKLQRAS